MAEGIVKCICVLHNKVIGREGLDEASLLELQNQKDSFSTNLDEPECQVTQSNNTSNLRARQVKDAFTVYFNNDVGRLPENVIDYNSADKCVTDSDVIMCVGHVLCPIMNRKLLLYYSLTT